MVHGLETMAAMNEQACSDRDCRYKARLDAQSLANSIDHLVGLIRETSDEERVLKYARAALALADILAAFSEVDDSQECCGGDDSSDDAEEQW